MSGQVRVEGVGFRVDDLEGAPIKAGTTQLCMPRSSKLGTT